MIGYFLCIKLKKKMTAELNISSAFFKFPLLYSTVLVYPFGLLARRNRLIFMLQMFVVCKCRYRYDIILGRSGKEILMA